MLSACSKFDIKAIRIYYLKNTLDSTTTTSATISVVRFNKPTSPFIQQGICWSTNPSFTYDSINNIKESDTASSYNVVITGLSPGITYYAHAYAINVINSKNDTTYSDKILTFRTPAITPYFFGEPMFGGLIFYIDTTGQHGLVCGTTDLGGDSVFWNNSNDTLISTSTDIGTGYTNTQNLITYYGNDSISAPALCVNYRGGGYTDWFLPSKDELNQMYINLYSKGFGNFSSTGSYWSSSEYIYNGGYYAWSQYFNNGYQYYFNQGLYLKVRAVRAF